jgi:hypothetical protein
LAHAKLKVNTNEPIWLIFICFERLLSVCLLLKKTTNDTIYVLISEKEFAHMSMSLSELSKRIEREINISNNDVEGRYHPNEKYILSLCNLSLDLIIEHKKVLLTTGHLRKLEKTKIEFDSLLNFVKENISTHGYWSFWHMSSLVIITCFYYLALLKENKNNTIDLTNIDVWETLDAAVLGINYISGVMHPKTLGILAEISNQPNVDIKDVCKYLRKKIEILTEQ